MIAYQEGNLTRFEKENWKEFFRFYCNRSLLKEDVVIPDGYIPSLYIPQYDAVVMCRRGFKTIYEILFYLGDSYYRLACYCLHKGWVEKEEGAMFSKLWPLGLFKSNKK